MKNFLLETRRYISSLTLLMVYLRREWDGKLPALSPIVVATFGEMSACSQELGF